MGSAYHDIVKKSTKTLWTARRAGAAVAFALFDLTFTTALAILSVTGVFAKIDTVNNRCVVTVTNNGKPPSGVIEETGGLGNLRKRIEKAGGTMKICSAPVFSLTLII